jgi:hypothetical protein
MMSNTEIQARELIASSSAIKHAYYDPACALEPWFVTGEHKHAGKSDRSDSLVHMAAENDMIITIESEQRIRLEARNGSQAVEIIMKR